MTLECETSHTVSTKWQHNGKELSGMDHRELVQEGRIHRLVIKRAMPLDVGTYTCSVKDQITASTLIVHGLYFHYPDVLLDTITDKVVFLIILQETFNYY